MRLPAKALSVGSLVALLCACGPSTRALICVSSTPDGSTAVLYVCDDQPTLTVRVYYGAGDKDAYTLTGRARSGETVAIPLDKDSPGWQLTGIRSPLRPTSTIEADAEDGKGNRLGSSVYLRVHSIPTSPSVGIGRDPFKVLSASAFSQAARRAC